MHDLWYDGQSEDLPPADGGLGRVSLLVADVHTFEEMTACAVSMVQNYGGKARII